MKLVTKIKKWVEEEVGDAFPDVELVSSSVLSKGFFYEFLYRGDFRFCLFVQDLKDMPKINWFFYRPLCHDEISYWKGKYDFRLLSSDIKFTKSFLEIDSVSCNGEVHVVMNRKVPTLRIFRKDFKWVVFMGRTGGAS